MQNVSVDPLSALFRSQARPSGDRKWWVSKSDVVDYRRCPWAFWMIDSGQLSAETVVEEVPALQGFIDQGIAFESEVRAAAVAIPNGEIPTLSDYASSVIFGVPFLHVLLRCDLTSIGANAPDSTETASGCPHSPSCSLLATMRSNFASTGNSSPHGDGRLPTRI